MEQRVYANLNILVIHTKFVSKIKNALLSAYFLMEHVYVFKGTKELEIIVSKMALIVPRIRFQMEREAVNVKMDFIYILRNVFLGKLVLQIVIEQIMENVNVRHRIIPKMVSVLGVLMDNFGIKTSVFIYVEFIKSILTNFLHVFVRMDTEFSKESVTYVLQITF